MKPHAHHLRIAALLLALAVPTASSAAPPRQQPGAKAKAAALAKKKKKKVTAKAVRRRALADGAANLFGNPGFEQSLSGWAGYNATLARRAGGQVGAYSVRVSVTRSATDFSLYPAPRPVTSTRSADAYAAAAWVRTGTAARKVCLRVRELDGQTVIGSAESCVTAGASWAKIGPVAYTTKQAGRTLDAYLYVWGSKAGDTFDADDVTLVRGTIATPSTPPVVTSPPPPTAPSLRATALDSAHIALAWPAVAGAASYRVSRGARVIGTTQAFSFTDTLLWPSTQYGYTVQALDAAGSPLSAQSVTAATTGLPVTGFPRPFAATSFWNAPVGSAATSPSNGALMSYFTSHATNPNLSIGAWSVPVAEAHDSDPLFTVPCTRYACTLSAFGAFRIPVTAQADPSADGHLAVYDPASNREWDLWQGKWSGSAWSASAGAAVSMSGAGLAAANTGSGNAANFPLLGGLIRPEEIAQGHIDHALVFGLPGIGAGAPVCPATHNAATSSDPNALREGTKLQLDPSVDVSALPIPAYAKIVARALQTYGMYLRDNSGALGIYAENPLGRGYNPWPAVLGTAAGDEYPSLAGIPWAKFRVLAAPDYPSC